VHLSAILKLTVTMYKVLVMDYLDGVPLSRAAEEMSKRGIRPDSPEAQLFGRKLLRSLTDVFGRCILETGFFHGESGDDVGMGHFCVTHHYRLTHFPFISSSSA